MKMNKFLMLGIAGLAFAACSNEEELAGISQTPEGEGAVTVKIVSPAMTKAIEEGTGEADGETVKVTGKMLITLSCAEGPLTKEVDVDENGTESEVTFWNVTSPTLVTVTMNDGLKSYADINIDQSSAPNMQALPASIPVYGEDVPELVGNIVRPGVSADDAQNENASEDGSDVNKNYQIYTATVNLTIPVARLEVSGITHIKHEAPATCKFKDLKITGVYMDNIRMSQDDDVANYRFPNDQVGGAEANSPLYDAIDPAEAFVNGTTWPHSTTLTTPVFAYNFYSTEAGDIAKNPSFKIRFTYSDDAGTVTNQTGYAYITKYMKGGSEIALQNGHIYKITEAEITDDNIVPGEDGEDYYAVTVTVVEATWTVKTITADWAE